MKRGTIVLAKFPFTDLSSSKRRPGIVVSKGLNNENDVIIAFISSVVPLTIESTDYNITTSHIDFPLTGLKKNSVIKADKLATINLSIITGAMGTVSADTMKEIDKCLKIALGL